MKKRIFTLLLAAVLLLAPAIPVHAANAGDYPLLSSTFNSSAVDDGIPWYPLEFEVYSDMLIQAVTTYHWNGGLGSTPGTIGIWEATATGYNQIGS